MSMDMGISGFVPPGEKWKNMKAIWDACEKAEIPPPDEVGKFFDWTKPSDNGMIVDIEKYAEKFTEEGRSGFDLDINKIPKNITKLRFYISY